MRCPAYGDVLLIRRFTTSRTTMTEQATAALDMEPWLYRW
jgi:hypothetical protein